MSAQLRQGLHAIAGFRAFADFESGQRQHAPDKAAHHRRIIHDQDRVSHGLFPRCIVSRIAASCRARSFPAAAIIHCRSVLLRRWTHQLPLDGAAFPHP